MTDPRTPASAPQGEAEEQGGTGQGGTDPGSALSQERRGDPDDTPFAAPAPAWTAARADETAPATDAGPAAATEPEPVASAGAEPAAEQPVPEQPIDEPARAPEATAPETTRPETTRPETTTPETTTPETTTPETTTPETTAPEATMPEQVTPEQPVSEPIAVGSAPAPEDPASASEPEPAASPEPEPEPVPASAAPGRAPASTPEPAAAPAAPSPTPLSPPTSAVPAAASATGALHDDSALRAAEAARSGEAGVPAPATSAPTPAGADGPDDLDDTRITAPNGTRASSWTPPPAPVSPSEGAAPAPVTTPTPYAPPTQTVPAVTSTTPISNLGTSPAESLGFADGIASDDDFTPEELAQRRAFHGEMVFRQKQEFSGFNFGAAFFGWLAATGLAVLLGGIAGGIAQASGFVQKPLLDGSADTISSSGTTLSVETLQIVALGIALFVMLISYFVGGFVAARMARFSGVKQGFAVWLWGVFLAIIFSVVAVVIGSQNSMITDYRDQLGTLTVNDFITVPALIVEGLIVVLSIGGALLGGLTGTVFHRRVDRFGIEEV